MSVEQVLQALALPPEAHVDAKVAKRLLADYGATTAADRRQVREAIDGARWRAALKPQTVGIPAHEDDDREYLEIAVITLSVRDGAKADRVPRIVHRAIPYPVLLLAGVPGGRVQVSAAHKRRSRSDPAKAVLDRDPVTVELGTDATLDGKLEAALPVSSQPGASVLTLYGGWMDCVVARRAAGLTGQFSRSASDEESQARLAALDVLDETDAEIERLRKAAAVATQMARRAELNNSIKRLGIERSEMLTILSGPT